MQGPGGFVILACAPARRKAEQEGGHPGATRGMQRIARRKVLVKRERTGRSVVQRRVQGHKFELSAEFKGVRAQYLREIAGDTLHIAAGYDHAGSARECEESGSVRQEGIVAANAG